MTIEIVPVVPAIVPLVPATAPPIEDELSGILTKFDNDPRKIAKSYKDLQSHSDSQLAKYAPPKEYSIKEEFADLDPEATTYLLETAKAGAYTQAQLDTLAQRVNENVKGIKAQISKTSEQRKVALGDESEILGLRTFYNGKVPEELLESIIKQGDPEVVRKLKNFKENMLASQSSAALGDKVTIDTIPSVEKVAVLRAEMVNLHRQRNKAPMEQHLAIDSKINRIANEVSALIIKERG